MNRWGIIGCGDVVKSKSGPSFNSLSESTLISVMRRNPTYAEEFKNLLGAKRFTTDAMELILDEQINSIYIATPPSSHKSYALACIQANKHCYIEKPVGMNADEALEIKKQLELQNSILETNGNWDNGDIKVVVAHYRRALPAFQRIKEDIQDNLIGNILSVNINTHLSCENDNKADAHKDDWRLNPAISGGGRFHDLSPHQLDLMMYFFGHPVSAQGMSCRRRNHKEAGSDVTQGTAVFGHIPVVGSWVFGVTPEDEKDECIINGDHGSIKFNFFGPSCKIIIDTSEHDNNNNTEAEFVHPDVIQQPFIHEVNQYFLDNSTNSNSGWGSNSGSNSDGNSGSGVCNPCSIDEAIKIMRVIDAFSKPPPELAL